MGSRTSTAASEASARSSPAIPASTPQRLVQSSSVSSIEHRTERVEEQSGRDIADFNLYYRLYLPADEDEAALIDELNALDIVELAQPDATAAPLPNHAGPTPSFVNRQNYRSIAPIGIDADYANGIAGGTGANARIVDLEFDWRESHEDLDNAAAGLIANGTQNATGGGNEDHGTAVLGEMIGTNDAVGVTGAAHGSPINMVNTSNTAGYNFVNAMNLAVTNTTAGDVLLIEQQIDGPNGDCNSMTQESCVAMEWFGPYYDAIVAATAAGRIVIEPAGNGGEDLDDAMLYGSPFPSGKADSGAIFVGAGGNNLSTGCSGSATHSRLNFSNFGARLNYHGYGQCVMTTGYGTVQDDPNDDFDYDNDFGGTSSASPIVTSAAAILSSVAQQNGDADGLTSVEARTALATGATPQDTSSVSGNIGPMPNLRAALGGPTAVAGGPYNGTEGTAVSLNGSASSDQAPGTITNYDWDLDNDAAYDDATGANPSFLRGDNGVYPISLRVTDNNGNTATDSSTVTLTNVPPAVALDPAQDMLIAEGDTLSAAATFTDKGYDDTYTGVIDWGDGDEDNPASVAVNTQGPPQDEGDISGTHTYPDPGTYSVDLLVRDDEGGTGDDAFTLTVVPRCEGVPSTVVGTPGDDELHGTSGRDVVFADAGDDDIRTGDDNDLICAGPGEDRTAGRAGNDIVFDATGDGSLIGGPGHDVLLGEGDDDAMRGGAGVDFLEGGSGTDWFHGGSGNDRCDNSGSETAKKCES